MEKRAKFSVWYYSVAFGDFFDDPFDSVLILVYRAGGYIYITIKP